MVEIPEWFFGTLDTLVEGNLAAFIWGGFVWLMPCLLMGYNLLISLDERQNFSWVIRV